MKTFLAIVALSFGLSACEYYRAEPPAPPPPAPPPPRHAPVDACGASNLQYLLGRSTSDIPQNYGRNRQRVVSSGSYITDQFDPERLTIMYDEHDGRISRVRCG